MNGTQKEYADHIGKSKQYVNKLVKQGKINLEPDGSVDFAKADFSLNRNTISGVGQNSDRGDRGEPPLDPPSSSNRAGGGPSYNDARTAREAYQAKMAKLEYEQKVGLVVNKRDVENAMVGAGRAIRQKMDALPALSGEIIAFIHAGNGEVELRKFIQGKVRALEETIADALTGVAKNDGDG